MYNKIFWNDIALNIAAGNNKYHVIFFNNYLFGL